MSRDDWRTPAWLFDPLHERFGFTVDAAANAGNAKLPRWRGPGSSDSAIDGLAQSWDTERVWCNPPYGAAVGLWVEKAARSRGRSVLLVPVRTETAWWHEHAMRADQLLFVRGRVHFERPDGVGRIPGGSRPTFASIVLIYEALTRIGPMTRKRAVRIGPTILTPQAQRAAPLAAAGPFVFPPNVDPTSLRYGSGDAKADGREKVWPDEERCNAWKIGEPDHRCQLRRGHTGGHLAREGGRLGRSW